MDRERALETYDTGFARPWSNSIASPLDDAQICDARFRVPPWSNPIGPRLVDTTRGVLRHPPSIGATHPSPPAPIDTPPRVQVLRTEAGLSTAEANDAMMAAHQRGRGVVASFEGEESMEAATAMLAKLQARRMDRSIDRFGGWWGRPGWVGGGFWGGALWRVAGFALGGPGGRGRSPRRGPEPPVGLGVGLGLG